MKFAPDWTIRLGRQLRKEGWVYREIAEVLGFGETTVWLWCNEGQRKKNVQRAKVFYHQNKEKSRVARRAYSRTHRKNNYSRARLTRLRARCSENEWALPLICEDELASVLDNHSGFCDLCDEASDRTLHLDHCHRTGKVRGLLCHYCNRLLGSYEKAVELGAENYLKGVLHDST